MLKKGYLKSGFAESSSPEGKNKMRARGQPLGGTGDRDTEKSSDRQKRTYCICRKSHENGFMIACDECDEWFHGKCVNITATQGKRIGKYKCPFCTEKERRGSSSSTRRVTRHEEAHGYSSIPPNNHHHTGNRPRPRPRPHPTRRDDDDDDYIYEDDEEDQEEETHHPEEEEHHTYSNEVRFESRVRRRTEEEDDKGNEEEAYVRTPWYDPETDTVDHDLWRADARSRRKSSYSVHPPHQRLQRQSLRQCEDDEDEEIFSSHEDDQENQSISQGPDDTGNMISSTSEALSSHQRPSTSNGHNIPSHEGNCLSLACIHSASCL